MKNVKKSILAFWPILGANVSRKIYFLFVYFSFFVLSSFGDVVLKTNFGMYKYQSSVLTDWSEFFENIKTNKI